MKNRLFNLALTTLTLILPALPARTQEEPERQPKKTESKATRANKAKAATEKTKGKAKAKAEADAKRIDINSATKAQLKTIPGLTEADVDRIIAGRPYLTKAHLVLNKVIPEVTYHTIRGYIAARQPAAKR